MSARLTEAWYRERPGLLWLLWPLALLFGLIALLRRALYRAGWLTVRRFDAPVIVVGNINVGGVGKTPLTLYLARYLREQGWRPGIVSRGYGGKGVYPLSVNAGTPASACGDEPLLMHRESGAPVVVDPMRSRAVEHLLNHHGCDIVLSDDGLQHYALHRDLELVVMDGRRGLGNGCLMPVGPLRESRSRLDTVGAVLINGSSEDRDRLTRSLALPPERSFGFHLRPEPLRPVGDTGPTAVPVGETVHAVAGIGNPERFFVTLREAGYSVIPHAFPDHHAFTAADLEFGDNLPVIMTAKDAVKCRGFAAAHHWYLPVSAEPDPEFVHFMRAYLDRCHEMKHHAG